MTPERVESPNPQNKSAESLIRKNGELIEELFSSEPWLEIAFPLLSEMIAGASGRFTNGRFYKGSLTRDDGTISIEKLSGYQMALEDFYNSLDDFIKAKEKLKMDKRLEEIEKKAPVYNPFLEELHEENQY